MSFFGRFALAFAVASIGIEGAAAASPSSKLVYIRSAGAEACPGEDDLRKAVAARLGYDPFFTSAQKTVVAQVSRTSGGYRGKVQIVGDGGVLRGERELATKGDDCGELVATMALAVSIALDDLDEDKGKPPPKEEEEKEKPPAARPPPVPEPEDPRATPPARPPPTRLDFAASLGPTLSLGTAPSVAVGGSLAGTVGYGAVAARLAFRGELPASSSFPPGGTVSTHTVVGTLEACVRGRIPFACAGAGLGSFATETTGIPRPATDSARLISAVVTVGARAALGGGLYLEPNLQGALGLTPERVEVDGNRVYTLPRIAGTLALHVGLSFL